MSLSILSRSPAWAAAGWTMLHVLWVGAVIGLLAAFTRKVLRSSGPQSRYLVALFWFLILAVSPVAVFAFVFEPSPKVIRAQIAPATLAQPVGPAGTSVSKSSLLVRPEPLGLGAITVPDAGYSWINSVVFCLPALWLAGSVSAICLLATGLIGVHRMARSSRVLETGEIPRQMRMLARSLCIMRRVRVGICDRVAVPVLVGIVRPLILLPPSALCGWSIDQLEMVLLHELAHLRRLDNVVNLVQRAVESLLFFHPVVWWLSSWIRLERELCCDRLVIDRVGQPVAYGEMLLTLAGRSQPGHVPLLAMADREVVTRIRRLFDLEDRSMKLTMPEGLGLVGAVIIAASLVLGLRAAQPQPPRESDESVRQALRKAVEEVDAIPRAGLQFDTATDAFANIAKAQLELGDRAAALATLQRAYKSIDQFEPKNSDLELFGMLCQVAKYQREAGDSAAARITLDRLIKFVDSLMDFSREEELIQITGTEKPRRVKHEMGAVIRCELLAMIADEWLILGDRDRARALYERAVEIMKVQKDILNPIVLATVGSKLFLVGDAAGGRDVIDQAERTAAGFTDPKDKEGALPFVAQAMVEIGDFDRALALVQRLGKHGASAALHRIIESFADDDYHGSWDDAGGIKIVIGADAMKVKDKVATRQAMPKIAQAVREIGDVLLQVRALSMISNLQAQAGDFDGAGQTADSIPNIRRRDFPGPSDGFYDAIKPATLAINARLQYAAGDKAGASQGFRRAIALSRVVETADQKLIAQILITQKQIECGDNDGARALVSEAVLFALQQPEPARSRSLSMLVESQTKAGDPDGAAKTISAIRDYPGIEKRRALGSLANFYEKAGDHTTANAFLRRELQLAEARLPVNSSKLSGKVKPPRSFTARSFVDFEYELDEKEIEQQKLTASIFLHSRLGEHEKALRAARTLPDGMRDNVLSNLAGNLARRGDVAGAFKLAAALETPQQRLWAFDLTAIAIREGRTRQ
jgi:beta-lactamase regulating signal transducer with metallopeptidase domain/tetratricopeptide (TPR) repeat protein